MNQVNNQQDQNDKIICPFCSPLEPIITENSLAKVLFSDPRKVPGHLLVVPKRHIEKPWKLTSAEVSDIFKLIFSIEQKIIPALGEGCDIRQNYRPFIDQGKIKLNHVTFHILPRSSNDYIYKVSEKYEKDIFAELDDSEKLAIIKLIQTDL